MRPTPHALLPAALPESFGKLTAMAVCCLDGNRLSGTCFCSTNRASDPSRACACRVACHERLRSNKQLTAAGLEPFCASSPPKLATLYLRSCDLDGELACHVVPVLHLTNFCITDAEKARVRAALPNCKGLYLD